MEEFAKRNSTRNNSSFAHFEKYFIRNEEEKMASIKDWYSEEIKNKINKCPNLVEGVEWKQNMGI